MRAIDSVIGVVRKAVVIPTVGIVTGVRSFILGDALHTMEHGLGISGRIAHALHDLLDPNPSYGP